MNVFDLFAKLSLDSSEYDQGLSDAEKKGSSFGKGFATATKVGATALVAVGTAAVGAGKSLVSGAADVASYGDNIDKMSQKIGISAEAYQEWDAVMQHCGASVDSLQPSMKTLATQAEKGNEAFQQLGISEEDVANLSQEDLFARVISGLQDMEEGTERTYIASQLLGRGATELGALFNTSAEETQEMKDRVHELGGVMSDDAVKSAAAFQDQLQDMQTGFAGLKRGLMGNFLPSLTAVMGGLTEIFSGNYDEGLEQISDGINAVVENLAGMMPQILEIGVGIIEALATSLLENLPTILPALVDLVMGIGDMIIDNLPLLVDVAMQVILQLALGIAQALPTLIPQIVDVVLTIVDTLIDNVDLLVDGAIALIIGLAEGLIDAMPKLIEKAPEIIIKFSKAIIRNAPKIIEAAFELMGKLIEGIISFWGKVFEIGGELITKFIDGIKSFFSNVVNIGADIIGKVKDGIAEKIEQAKTWGKDLIDNFVQGIKDKIQKVKDTVGAVAQTVKDFLGFSEPKEGALSNFHTYAPDMMNLFAQGIKANEDMLQNTVAEAFDFQNTIMKENAESVSATSGSGNFESQVISLLQAILDKGGVELSVDAQGIFDVVRQENNRYYNQTGVSAFA